MTGQDIWFRVSYLAVCTVTRESSAQTLMHKGLLILPWGVLGGAGEAMGGIGRGRCADLSV